MKGVPDVAISADALAVTRRRTGLGEASQRMLADIQGRAFSRSPSTVVLVEGLSDWFALETLAARSGRNLSADRVAIVPMGGATNLGRFLDLFGRQGRNLRLAGLCDEAEQEHFRQSLERAGLGRHIDRSAMESLGFFVCVRDLEEELIRALGVAAVEAIIEGAGDLPSLRTLQQMPFHRDRSPEQQLHRFMGVRSGRKYRYAQILAQALPADHVPRPLHALLDDV